MQVRMTRTAISPRLATSTLLNRRSRGAGLLGAAAAAAVVLRLRTHDRAARSHLLRMACVGGPFGPLPGRCRDGPLGFLKQGGSGAALERWM